MARYTKEGLRRAELVKRFFEKHLHLVDDKWAGQPFILEPYQYENIIKPIFGTLYKGKRKYTEALIGLPRKHYKTTTSAGIGLYCLTCEPVIGQEVYSVAADKAQAGIIFNAAKKMCAQDPILRSLTKGGIFKDTIYIAETDSFWRVLPYSEAAAQGWHPRVVIIDEYHVHKSSAMRDAMLSGMGGRSEPLLITLTTAGKEQKGPLWDLLQTIREDPSAYLWWWGAKDEEDGHDPKVWRKYNIASSITDEFLLNQYRKMPFSQFERYHLNRYPTAGAERAFDPIRVSKLAGRSDLDPDLPCVIAIDASLRRDSTGVVLDQLQPDGTHLWKAWKFGNRPGDRTPLGHIDHVPVENLLRELWREYNVTRIACDPNYFVRSMSDLYNEGLPIEEYPQEPRRMVTASMFLYDVILEGRARTDNNADLVEHLQNAGIYETGFGWRLTKVREDLKIDLAIACAIATYLSEGDGGWDRPLAPGGLVV